MAEKLSGPQLELLRQACGHGGGKISTWGTLPRTLAILRAAGYIQEDLAIRDPAARGKFLDGQRTMIAMAKDQLEQGDWPGALSSLQSAQHTQWQLDKKADWITEAGRAAVGDAAQNGDHA